MATIYRQLCAIASRVVEHYRTDVTVHDKALCRTLRTGNSAFWAVRSHGSHWFWLAHPDDAPNPETVASLRERLNWIDATVRVFPDCKWYLAESTNGQHGAVVACSADHARKRLAQRLAAYEAAARPVAA